MYVCLCHAVKDSEIAEAVANGHHDLDAISDALGVGTGCGSCQSLAQSIIDASLDGKVSDSNLFYAA